MNRVVNSVYEIVMKEKLLVLVLSSVLGYAVDFASEYNATI